MYLYDDKIRTLKVKIPTFLILFNSFFLKTANYPPEKGDSTVLGDKYINL